MPLRATLDVVILALLWRFDRIGSGFAFITHRRCTGIDIVSWLTRSEYAELAPPLNMGLHNL